MQETPHSAYISIHKKFCSGFVITSAVRNNAKDIEQKLGEVNNVENTNEYLKKELEETVELLENIKSDKEVLQKHLEKRRQPTLKRLSSV